MDDKGFEDTQPTMMFPQTGGENDQKGVQPTISGSEAVNDETGLDKTMPTPVRKASDQQPATTTPTPVLPEAESQKNVNDDKGPASPAIPPSDGATAGVRIASSSRRRSITWLVFPILGLLALMLIAFLSGVSGYFSGISLRKSAETTQVALVIQEQYQLGLQEMAQGEYQRARQRFEYVIQLDPNFPGVTEKLSEVLLELNTTATPTPIPTPTITPTPDTRGNQELFDQGQQYLLNKDWKNAIETLLSLRKADPTYRTVEVDGMLFLALRNQGVDKIMKEADLEGGIYDLTLASRFGLLDAEAQGFLNWTGLYITGASFWGIDWEQAVNYFSQVAPQLPYLRDGSGMTATERLRTALFEYGNTLARQGQFCRALQMYQQSLSIAPDPQVQEAAALAEKGCSQGGASQPGKTPKPGKKTPTP